MLQQGRLIFNVTPAGLAARARGKVWEVELEQAEWTALQSSYHLISSRPQDGRVHLRLVGMENPLGRGRSLEPSVEDGYVALISGNSVVAELEHAPALAVLAGCRLQRVFVRAGKLRPAFQALEPFDLDRDALPLDQDSLGFWGRVSQDSLAQEGQKPSGRPFD